MIKNIYYLVRHESGEFEIIQPSVCLKTLENVNWEEFSTDSLFRIKQDVIFEDTPRNRFYIHKPKDIIKELDEETYNEFVGIYVSINRRVKELLEQNSILLCRPIEAGDYLNYHGDLYHITEIGNHFFVADEIISTNDRVLGFVAYSDALKFSRKDNSYFYDEFQQESRLLSHEAYQNIRRYLTKRIKKCYKLLHREFNMNKIVLEVEGAHIKGYYGIYDQNIQILMIKPYNMNYTYHLLDNVEPKEFAQNKLLAFYKLEEDIKVHQMELIDIATKYMANSKVSKIQLTLLNKRKKYLYNLLRNNGITKKDHQHKIREINADIYRIGYEAGTKAYDEMCKIMDMSAFPFLYNKILSRFIK